MIVYIKVNHLLNLKLPKYPQIVPIFRVEPANKGNIKSAERYKFQAFSENTLTICALEAPWSNLS